MMKDYFLLESQRHRETLYGRNVDDYARFYADHMIERALNAFKLSKHDEDAAMRYYQTGDTSLLNAFEEHESAQ
jgi:hypothetical protein